MHKDAIISKNGKHRYRLTRIWDFTKPKLCWIMLNPSTADADTDDPTIRRVIEFTKRLNYGGVEVINVFSYRTKSPKELRKAYNKGLLVIDDRTRYHARTVIHECLNIVVAWGSDPMAKMAYPWLSFGMKDPWCLGTNKDGSPKHPLYLPKDTEREYWEGYK